MNCEETKLPRFFLFLRSYYLPLSYIHAQKKIKACDVLSVIIITLLNLPT